MKVFISWSGDRSKHVALALRDWLTLVLQAVEPWVSAVDIDAGKRWAGEIAENLGASDFGILCVTPENQTAPWLLFEAGALAKKVDVARVVPYLIGFEDPDRISLSGPLAGFQAKSATKKRTLEVVQSLNTNCPKPMTAAQVDRLFEKWWDDLDKQIAAAPKPKAGAVPPKPEPGDVMAELAAQIRSIAAELSEVRRWVRPASMASIASRGGVVPTGVSSLVARLSEEQIAEIRKGAGRAWRALEKEKALSDLAVLTKNEADADSAHAAGAGQERAAPGDAGNDDPEDPS